MQGLGRQCHAGGAHGFTPIWAVEGHSAAQLCKLSSGGVCCGPAEQQPVGHLCYGELTALCTQWLRQLLNEAARPGAIGLEPHLLPVVW